MTTAERLTAEGIDPTLFSDSELRIIASDVENLRRASFSLPQPPENLSAEALLHDNFREALHRTLIPCIDALEKNALLFAFSKEHQDAVAVPFLAFCDTLPQLLRTAEDQLDRAITRQELLEASAEENRAHLRRLVCLDVAARLDDCSHVSDDCRAAMQAVQAQIEETEQQIETQTSHIRALTVLLEEKLPAFLAAGNPLLEDKSPLNLTVYRTAAIALRLA